MEKDWKRLENEVAELKRENIYLRTKGAKTCRQLKEHGFNTSGEYHIDPDSTGAPIKVFCDMSTGTTEISHDGEAAENITHCSGEGCFKKTYTYSAPMSQVEALIEMSEGCSQDLQFQCNIAPLKNTIFGFHYGWWEDTRGQKNYYFDGSDPDEHICGCYPNCLMKQKILLATATHHWFHSGTLIQEQ